MSIYRHQDTGEVEFFHVERDAVTGEFLKTSDVLKLLQIGGTTLTRRVQSGLITPHHSTRRGSVTTYWYSRDDVERLRRLREGH